MTLYYLHVLEQRIPGEEERNARVAASLPAAANQLWACCLAVIKPKCAGCVHIALCTITCMSAASSQQASRSGKVFIHQIVSTNIKTHQV